MDKYLFTISLGLPSLLSCTNNKDYNTPNILLIMADDLGYSDIGCYGGEISTPNLDQLASEGIRFTQFYNTARSCPTRACLMTGLYPHEAGVGHMTGSNMGHGYFGCLNDSCVTIAEVLGSAGYYTGMAGKWHAGNDRNSWPENRGFQYFWGTHNYIDSYFKVLNDCEVFENGKMVISEDDYPALGASPDTEWYTTDVFTNKAIESIDKSIAEGKPFFQYLAFNSPHWPLEAHDDVIDKYLESYKDGYELLRKQKYERMLEMGIVSKDWKFPDNTMPEWDLLSDSSKLDTEFRRAIYAAQVEIMDEHIGRIVEHLKRKNILDNTVIIFLSDNGCSAEPENQVFGYQWGKNTKWNYNEWRRNSARKGASQGMVWAIASNSPYKLYKKFTHEGGISTPLIVHWPKAIKKPGSIDNKPGHIIDIMATCIELAGAKYPETRNNVPVRKYRGISFAKNIKGEKSPEHEAIFWEHEGHGALRMSKWKLVSANPQKEDEWELYDMEKDRTEMNDLSEIYPEKRSEMIEKWTQLAYDTKALPWPDFSKAKPVPIDK
ncbi:MAG: arylsulfatase [Tannerella sp.]|jgi:arylsulfatase|nr:arylsulfatase [Tannerella sp.]